MDSILISVKKMLGIDEGCDHFDADIIMHINSVLAILNQLGVGPPTGFFIMDSGQKWSDFIPDQTNIEFIKTYVFMKVKLIFDPPQMSALIDAMNKTISELEWRITVAVDPVKSTEGEEGNSNVG